MSNDKVLDTAKNVIRIEAEAVSNLLNNLGNEFIRACRKIFECTGRVVFTGMGKSGLVARKIVATLNSTGTPAIYLHPTDALHGDLGMVRKEDIVIIISKSGNTEELYQLIDLFKRLGVTLIGFLGNMNSNLARLCDINIDISVKEEACPYDLAPTASTTATLAMGDALAVSLLELRGFTAQDFALLHPGGSLGKRLSLKISEIMYTGDDVPIVNEDASIKDTIIEMTSKRLGATSVVNADGALTGIITDGDLRRLLEKTEQITGLTAKKVMSKNPKIISPEFLASFALQQMEKFNITSLIVAAEDRKPVGIVHLHDLVKLGLQQR
ncbi:MAG: KpsF/GutQ family sugar-phosphate isomerase [Melioribacteraceae bacterium]|nr:KpsF/GutQ family sugar-phosphate isomerase [Melioribacteraceae bacterium]MCF8355107.1 KpsF/GutQ family sugar-phosphate isomerase [Melioribacteraceae bacterium]MCF8392416.1 KpsF/GutQ family sugar-phosphate isomerase [Melioribacteraceae bacterium]MCF8417937.1 KpsF/GutQ family sugar-phosphate isomerase [Melioribacteraceae bacterium]